MALLVLYPFLLVFVSPVTNDLPRYFLPIAPLVAIAAGRALGRGADCWPPRARALTTLLILLLFVVKPVVSVLGSVVEQSRRGYRFDEIMERTVSERINAVAPVGATVLAYEVQDRYFLRPDLRVLSLDGITDGEVGPYLRNADIGAFLRRFHPRYWIANDAVDYRPYLRRSILHTVYHRVLADPTRSELAVDGITFRVIDRRHAPLPPGFAGWRVLFELGYAGVPAPTGRKGSGTEFGG